MYIKWTLEEKEFIRENAGVMKDRDLAQKLADKSGRRVTVDALRKVRQKLGIKKKHGRGICAVVYSPVESQWENEDGTTKTIPDQSG